jgi:hypothetical protein
MKAQEKFPVRGDWVISEIMKTLDLDVSEMELKMMTKFKLKNILYKKINEKSLKYLLSLQKSKGSEIRYDSLKMAEYLLPNENKLTISDKKLFFSIRNRLINIHGNYQKKNNLNKYCKAGCDIIDTNEHIYECKKLNDSNKEIQYKEILNGTTCQQIKVFERMKTNLVIRNEMFS